METDKDPEHSSVESFVQFCLDDERDSFLPGDAQRIAVKTGDSMESVTSKLVGFGLKLRTRARSL